MFIRIIGIFLVLFSNVAPAQIHDPKALNADPLASDGPIAPVLSGLGKHHFKVTTSVPRSQLFFDQGLRLTYGFNHSEALRAFKEAARLDPNNAMAYWGWALVLGPNLNLPMQSEVVPRAYQAMQKALALKEKVSPKEKAYIEALAVRYAESVVADRSALDAAYVETMSSLVKRYPEDSDAATLYAAAVMNTNPWDYWYKDGSPKPHTEIILETLQAVIARSPRHAGAHHYLIHTVEAFRPELGVASADILGGLMPGAGHLVHMPSHIYMRVGRYADSYKANALAVKADERYITQCRAQGLYPLAYYPHNLHFQVWSAMFQGRSKAALEAGQKVAGKIPPGASGNTWGLYEAFRAQPMFVTVRFGLWEAMLEDPKPEDSALFMNGVWHYGRGLAYLHGGNLPKAREELGALVQLRNKITDDQGYYIGFGAAGNLLTIAEEVVLGELAAAEGDFNRAASHLERAVRLEDGLRYNEPPDWYFPVRHLLGAVLLEAGRPEEAEVVYWEDLRRNPENGYSLFGLKQSLSAQGKEGVASVIEARFQRAWKDADIVLSSSRY